MFKARDIHIVIHGGRNQIFYPGARISGEVVYKTMTNEMLQQVSIDLRGTEKSLRAKNTLFASSPEFIEVFHFNEVLQKTSTYTGGKTMSWPFDMTLPLQTGPDRSDRTIFYSSGDGDDLFDIHPHALAPTVKSDQSYAAQVEYQMYAVAVYGMQTFGSGGFLAQCTVCDLIETLNYQPDIAIGRSQDLGSKTVEYTVGQGKVRRSLMSTIISGSRTTTFKGDKITITAQMPCQVVVGQYCNIIVCLQGDGSQELPDYNTKDSTASLKSSTYCRTKDCSFDPAMTEIKISRLDNRTTWYTVGRDPQSFTFATDKIKDWPSSFKSYSIARAYQLIFRTRIFFGSGRERSEELVELVSDVELVRQVTETELQRRWRTNIAPPPSLAPHPVPIEEDELPCYTEHASDVLIGRGEAVNEDDVLESLAVMRTSSAQGAG